MTTNNDRSRFKPLLILLGGMILSPLMAFGGFAVIAGLGQKFDPSSPGDQWLFLGFVGGGAFGLLVMLLTLVWVGFAIRDNRGRL